MKIIITTIFCWFCLLPSYGQRPSQDLAYSYETEMTRFHDNISFLYDHLLESYDDFNNVLAVKTLRIMKSEHSYPSLVPMEFNLFMKITDKIVPGSEGVSKIFTGLLEKGWTAHNEEIEANRKNNLINGQIMTYAKNLSDETAFKDRMGPFLKRGSKQSDFKVKIDDKFYTSTQKEGEHIFEELYEINEALEKHPIISNRDNVAATSMKKLFYEDYIRQFANIHHSTNSLNGTSGSLVGYLEFDDDFNLVSKVLVADVPAGYEIGTRSLNDVLPKLKRKPLDLKVIKVLFINSPYYHPAEPDKKRKTWSITLTELDNTIARMRLTKMIANEPTINLQPGSEYKHYQRFLKKFGFKDKNSGLWRIKRSLFNEFTEIVPKRTKNIPKYIRDMIEL